MTCRITTKKMKMTFDFIVSTSNLNSKTYEENHG